MSRAGNAAIGQAIGQGFQTLAGAYAKKDYIGILNDPDATPLQKAVASSNIDPSLVKYITKQNELDSQKKFTNDLMKTTEANLPQNRRFRAANEEGGNQVATNEGNPPDINALRQEFAEPDQMDPIEMKREEAKVYNQSALEAQAGGAKDAAASYRSLAKQANDTADAMLQSNSRTEAAEIKAIQKEKDRTRSSFESDRNFETSLAKPTLDQANKLRESIPRQKMALAMSREASSSGDLNPFSRNHMSQLPGLDWLKTADKVKLDIARKENLIGTLSKVTGRAQNVYLEKVAASAFPDTGQTLETNLTAQELIEANLALDEAEERIVEKLAREDIERFGYVKGDIGARKFNAMKPIEDQILERTSYRVRELKESEMGLEKMRNSTEKPVPKGTPLTRKMARVFLEKIKGEMSIKERQEKAIIRAKQLGYIIIPDERVDEYAL